MTKWIVCAERLPPERMRVLIWHKGNTDMILISHRDYHAWQIGQQIGGSMGTYFNESITHWQPLPESPLITKTEIE